MSEPTMYRIVYLSSEGSRHYLRYGTWWFIGGENDDAVAAEHIARVAAAGYLFDIEVR